MKARVLGAVLFGLLVGCTADPSVNPGYGCVVDADCETGARCYRGFCVVESMDGGADGCGTEVLCNGMSDDCDDQVDEFPDPQCDTGLPGACGEGEWVCSEGAPSCARSALPSPETCNGRDDDCDDRVDELGPTRCYADATIGCSFAGDDWTCVGTCRTGMAACSGGVLGSCDGVTTPVDEACGGTTAVDEDCDGLIDEGCSCTADQSCYGGPEGTAGVGACRAGEQTCVSGELDPTCRDQVVPRPETCSNGGVDDDCNGVTDDVPRLGDPCVDTSAIGDCRLGRLVCGSDSPTPQCEARAPAPETCDGNDEDCDGRVDETFDRSTDPANCGACGVACGPEEMCCGGVCADTRASSSHCGACAADGGAICGPSEVCCGGSCADAASCGSCMDDCAAMGRECCIGACVDTDSDESNCGGCGLACGAGQLCCAGICVGSDPSHCGQSCSTCTAGSELCCAGACVAIDNDNCNACGFSCSTGDCCASGCVDLAADSSNCGGCGMPCPSGQGCSQSHCCPTGQTWCDALGGCRDLASDSNSCGSCGNSCGAGSRCCGGSCRLLSLGC